MIKRTIAFLIDLLIIGIIFIALYEILPVTEKVKELNHENIVIKENLLKGEITKNEYYNHFITNSYNIDYENKLITALDILLVIIYFIIIPLLNGGKTLGLYLMNLKIGGKLSVFNLFIRNIFTTGILYMLICLLSIYLFDEKIYFLVITICGFIQFLLVILSVFMIIYRKDKKGLQDKFSKTKIEVIE